MSPFRLIALIALAIMQSDPARQARDLVEKLRSEKVEEREEATRKLKELGKQALPELSKAASSPDAEVAARAKHLLGVLEIREKLTPKLLKIMPDVDERLASNDEHSWTVVLLEAFGPKGADGGLFQRYPDLRPEDFEALAAPAIRGARTPEERRSAVRAAGSWRLRTAIPEIVKIVNEKNDPGDLRPMAMSFLHALDPKGNLDVFLKLLKDENSSVRGMAVNILKLREAKEAVPELLSLLKDEKPEFRVTAVEGLMEVRARGAVSEVLPLLDDPNARVRLATVEALRSIGAKSEASKIALRLKDRSGYIRARTVGILADLAAKAAVPDLVEALKDEDPYVRFEAVQALDRIAGKDALDSISTVLADPHPGVRCHAAEYLCRMGLRKGIPIQLEAMNEGNFEFKWSDEATNMVSAKYVPPSLVALNAFREPQLWERLKEQKTKRSFSGKDAEVLKSLADEAGLRMESLPEEFLKHQGAWTAGMDTPVLFALKASVHSPWDLILEADRIRVLPREEALKFWTSWWKGEQEKK
jgi:HEAT repeat protein